MVIAWVSDPRAMWSHWEPQGARGSSLFREAAHLVPPGALPPWALPRALDPVNGDIRVAGIAVIESWAFLSAASGEHGRFMARYLLKSTHRKSVRLGAIQHNVRQGSTGSLPADSPPPVGSA